MSAEVDQLKIRNAQLEKELAEKKRELEIEAALEKVRARTMAMQNSEELLHVIDQLTTQLRLIGFRIDTANFNANYRTRDWNLWMHSDGIPQPFHISIPYFDHPIFRTVNIAINKGESVASGILNRQEKDSLLQHLYQNTIIKHASAESKQEKLDKESFTYMVIFSKNTSITIGNYEGIVYGKEEETVLRRFGNVFELSYTRFLDLQQAEAQVREAQIEVAMEKLRSSAMAMQTSRELNSLIKTMYAELKRLDESLNRCFIMIFDEQTKGVTWWMAGNDDAPVEHEYFVPYSEHPPQQAYLKGWQKRQEKWQYVMEGEEKKAWDHYLFTATELTKLPSIVIQNMCSFEKIYLSASFSNFGCLTTGSIQPLSDESFSILLRFTKVFDLTYTRFNDLKQAEAQTREAQIQLALERVRARTMAMQNSNELAEVATLLFKQVRELGIRAWTTGFNVWSDDNNSFTDYITSPQGGFIEPYTVDAPIPILKDARKRGEEFLVFYLEGENLKEVYQELSKFGNKQQYEKMIEGGFQLPERQYNHFVFGAKVSLMFITYEPIPEAHDIFKRFGKVFEQTYTRFLDLQRVEEQAIRAEQDLIAIKAARKKAEDALAALKATQQQLIQAEKMASLGELTAGIAHEIQNPLNFINNFSEVSYEIAIEIEQEIENENKDEVIMLADGIKQNLQKVMHHGKRADAIVKSMLEHSRMASGDKQPTNINALADEYLRLAYHGFRTKNKSFNATIKSHFDDKIGLIKISPQDVGRVLLNLFNNAFYSVQKKSESVKEGYEPTVEVITMRKEENLLISIRDNGIGIPQNILDKVFQPFFTTKLTGEGTGLGLSLSYDLVKAHGGSITVSSKEGEGAVFTIDLPIS